ncbi:MAG: hypothetical protein ACKVY0_03230 [Prosthecobacter sp.]|uniref:hypothetical protein n=1 Tax=Prosthecobacter sp. TaxID=1965333 RepID=UPI0039012449
MNHDREGEHHPLARPAAGGGMSRGTEASPTAAGSPKGETSGERASPPAPPLGYHPGEGGAEHGLRGGAEPKGPRRDRQPLAARRARRAWGASESTGAGGEDSRDTRPDRATSRVGATLQPFAVIRKAVGLFFAEGRFLTIHPFRDFNGRTIRLLLTELLRRLDLPRVTLAPEGEAARAAYFLALEAADRFDWQPLMEVWNERLLVLS